MKVKDEQIKQLSDDVKDPSHYAGSYPCFEVWEVIQTIMDKYCKDMTPYDAFLMGNVIKYRLRAGFKDDGEGGFKDLKKALRCREMMSDKGVLNENKDTGITGSETPASVYDRWISGDGSKSNRESLDSTEPDNGSEHWSEYCAPEGYGGTDTAEVWSSVSWDHSSK